MRRCADLCERASAELLADVIVLLDAFVAVPPPLDLGHLAAQVVLLHMPRLLAVQQPHLHPDLAERGVRLAAELGRQRQPTAEASLGLHEDLVQPELGGADGVVTRGGVAVPHLEHELRVVHRRQRLVEHKLLRGTEQAQAERRRR